MFNKIKIADAFNQAAATYDQAAELQRIVACDLCARINTSAKIIVDLGCGTGFLTEKLAIKFPDAMIIGIDFANHMLHVAQKKTQYKNITWLCADIDQLPLADAQVDLVLSNLMLQWSTNLFVSLTEISRILKPNAELYFSTFAPGSLHELKQAWLAADALPHVHTFTTAKQLTTILKKIFSHQGSLEQKSLVIYYQEAIHLMRQLKMLGASNLQTSAAQGLITQKKLTAVIDAYEQFRSQGKIPATYEIYFGAIKK
jgi:malonyl-CoA O-methyltransferase